MTYAQKWLCVEAAPLVIRSSNLKGSSSARAVHTNAALATTRLDPAPMSLAHTHLPSALLSLTRKPPSAPVMVHAAAVDVTPSTVAGVSVEGFVRSPTT